jgi:trehalose 6-phosphate synthase/phosphatase
MPEKEQLARLKNMQKILRKQDVIKWAGDFIDELEKIHLQQRDIRKKFLQSGQLKTIAEKFNKSKNRLIVLDYDGTLVPFTKDPSMALPKAPLLKLLRDLHKLENSELAIVSGRNKEFLDEIFSDLPIIIFAEHGAHQRVNEEWVSIYRKDLSWQKEIIKIMQEVTDDTPGSMVEKKDTAIVWHYRNTDKWLSDLRAAQLTNKLIYPCTRKHLHLMRGNKIIEVKPAEYSKGTAIRNYFDCSKYDFILAAGDDTTDEDMFDVLPRNAITIKIGEPSKKAKYTITSSENFVKFLGQLAGNKKSISQAVE